MTTWNQYQHSTDIEAGMLAEIDQAKARAGSMLDTLVNEYRATADDYTEQERYIALTLGVSRFERSPALSLLMMAVMRLAADTDV